jgi:hypothetical protein
VEGERGFKGRGGEGWRGQTRINTGQRAVVFIIANSGHNITGSRHQKISSLMPGWAF